MLAALETAGCAASMTPAVTGNLDTRGRPGIEGTTEFAVGIKDGALVAFSAGAGRLGGFGSAHGVLAPAVGYSTVKGGVLGRGDPSFSNVAVSAFMPIRFFPGSAEPTRLGGGLQGQLTLRLHKFGASSQLELGPTLRLELVDGLGASQRLGGMVSAGVTLRMVTFDQSFRMF